MISAANYRLKDKTEWKWFVCGLCLYQEKRCAARNKKTTIFSPLNCFTSAEKRKGALLKYVQTIGCMFICKHDPKLVKQHCNWMFLLSVSECVCGYGKCQYCKQCAIYWISHMPDAAAAAANSNNGNDRLAYGSIIYINYRSFFIRWRQLFHDATTLSN